MDGIAKLVNSNQPNAVWSGLEGLRNFAYDNGLIGQKAPGGIAFVPNSLNEPATFGPLPALTHEYHRRFWYKYRLSRETAAVFKSLDYLSTKRLNEGTLNGGIESKGDASLTELIGALFKFVLWPFILAISLGLRLTKVTADVTGWAR
jgi:hypothetical protein